MNTFKVYKLGMVPYRKALDIQLSLLEKRKNGEIGDTLLLLEHPPTLTTGRRGNMANLLASEKLLADRGIQFEVISRGGDVTFHGPGQLVGYPILDLSSDKDVYKYLRRLEETIILALRPYGIPARSIEGVTGVWAKWHKIASIGVGFKKWITYHGFALNVNTDLSYFDLIVPCGIQDVRMTSIQRWLSSQDEVDMAGVEENIIKAFSQVFNKKHLKTVTLFGSDSEGSADFELMLDIEKRLER